jgi:hypothetical protein
MPAILMSSLRRPAALAFVLVLAAASACADQRENIAGIPPGAADGLYPQLVIAGPTASATEVRVSLLRKPAGTRLGSFQGELTYDAASLRFERATLPSGVDGVADAAAPGRIRFVGTALDGVGETALVELRFTRIGQVRPESFGVVFEEVTAADLTELTGQVHAGAPLVAVTGH